MPELYVRQRDPEEDLFTFLQRNSLTALQRLSGKVWTDYNIHDPGITLVDILNYALTELDYRLNFNLEDYLRTADCAFEPATFGLLPPEKVMASAVTTLEDYGKLIKAYIPEIETARVFPSSSCPDRYVITLELQRRLEHTMEEAVKQQVKKVYHAHRNLCEGLQEITIIRREELELRGWIEIMPGTDATRLLARLYQGTQDFLRALEQEVPVAVLRRQLSRIEGIKKIFVLELLEAGRVKNKVGSNCAVKIPQAKPEVLLRLQIEGRPVKVDVEKLKDSKLREIPKVLFGEEQGEPLPCGVYRNIYEHASVQDDFPNCYGINEYGVGKSATPLRKAQVCQFKAYLLLFDLTIARGLKELQELQQGMQLNMQLPEGKIPLEELTKWRVEELVDRKKSEEWKKREFLEMKTHLIEMWDRIYGEDSYPEWLKEYNYYDETKQEVLERRICFLQQVAGWGKDRSCSYNFYQGRSSRNIPGVKAYVCTLLGWEMDEGSPVVNIFPAYNLKLIKDKQFYEGPHGAWNHDLIFMAWWKGMCLEEVPLLTKKWEEKDFDKLCRQLPLFQHHLLFEGLFREGIRLENYKMIRQENQQDWLLVFRHRERDEWVNLGRFADPEKLRETANCLQQFLVMLNRKSETFYVVEHLCLEPVEPFTVTLVFAGWSARTIQPRFRAACEQLAASRIPAHLEMRACWLDIEDMWRFEKIWRDWRMAWIDENEENKRRKAMELAELLKNKS